MNLNKRWILKPKPDPTNTDHLVQVLGIPTTIGQLLVQRGVTSFDKAKDFFRPDLKELHDPFLMKDMAVAVDRIEAALRKQERILIYGDYDVDGTTSVALMAAFLRAYTDQIATYIPDRYTEGYGISYQGIDFASDNDFDLVIALDCGIKALRQMEYAAEKGIDFIICDHHLPGDELPLALAVLDPKRMDCHYPFKELCGCGVGFKLIQAIAQREERGVEELLPYMDLVAIAIGADVVPIIGENRTLAFYGLQVLNNATRPGLKPLVAQLKKRELSMTDVVFVIAPRINAAGRMKHALYAVELLLEQDPERAVKLAGEIELYNADRKLADQTITAEALRQIQEKMEEDKYTTVVYAEDWHKGVIGIVASRLIESYYRPTLVFTKNENKLAASARSVKGFDIYKALEACQEYIEQFGGHKYAAGLTLQEHQYERFKQKFEEVVAQSIDEDLLNPSILIDQELDFCAIDPKFWRLLKQFAPFGQGNNQPIFLTRNIIDTGFARRVGEQGRHLKCNFSQKGNPIIFEAIGFGLGDKLDLVSKGKPVNAVYCLTENEWNGQVRLQLNLKDLSQAV